MFLRVSAFCPIAAPAPHVVEWLYERTDGDTVDVITVRNILNELRLALLDPGAAGGCGRLCAT
jgi:hypothetical protein